MPGWQQCLCIWGLGFGKRHTFCFSFRRRLGDEALLEAGERTLAAGCPSLLPGCAPGTAFALPYRSRSLTPASHALPERLPAWPACWP